MLAAATGVTSCLQRVVFLRSCPVTRPGRRGTGPSQQNPHSAQWDSARLGWERPGAQRQGPPAPLVPASHPDGAPLTRGTFRPLEPRRSGSSPELQMHRLAAGNRVTKTRRENCPRPSSPSDRRGGSGSCGGRHPLRGAQGGRSRAVCTSAARRSQGPASGPFPLNLLGSIWPS